MVAALPTVTFIPKAPAEVGLRDEFLMENPDVFNGDRNKKGLMTNLICYASDRGRREETMCREWQRFIIKEIEHFTREDGEKIVNVKFYNTNITFNPRQGS